jgi:hypothetical protein
MMTELSAIVEARRRTTSGSPKTKPNAQIEIKARVDTNNRGGKHGQYSSYYQSPLTYVLMKGRVKSTFNYIVDNLHTYAEPLLQHVSKQSGGSYKPGHKEFKIKK